MKTTPKSKIISYAFAKILIENLRGSKNKIILAQGVFDIMHLGHLEFLKEGKASGDVLIVGLERDETVRLSKGEKRPINKLRDRMDFMAHLETVDFIFGFENISRYPSEDNIWWQRLSLLGPSKLLIPTWDPHKASKLKTLEQAAIKPCFASAYRPTSTSHILNLVSYA